MTGTGSHGSPQAWPMVLLLLLLQLSPWPTCMVQAQQVEGRHVSTGQELADAVAAWGASGSNMSISIDVPFISLRSVVFTNASTLQPANASGQAPFTRGILTIRGSSSDRRPTILDAAMRSGLIPGLQETALYILQDLVLINLCENVYAMKSEVPGQPAVKVSSAFSLQIFRGTPLYQGQVLNRVTLYGRRASVAFNTYQLVFQRAGPTSAITSSVSQLLQGPAAPSEPGDEFSPYSDSAKDYSLTSGKGQDVMLKAIENPNDELLNRLKAEGRIMPPQYCATGDFLSHEVLDKQIDPDMAPAWSASDQDSFMTGLKATSEQTTIQTEYSWPPAVILDKGPVVIPPTGSFKVARLMLLTSRASAYPTYDDRPVVIMNNRANVFNILPGATLYIQWLTLTGLSVQVPTRLPSAAALPPGSLLPSVFPLAAFNTSDSPGASTAPLILSNVTLVIPPDDYLALLILAAASVPGGLGTPCYDATIAQTIAQLQAGITELVFCTEAHPNVRLEDLTQLFVLKRLAGWNMNGSLVAFKPSSPLSSPITCTDHRNINNISRPQIVGLAVGLSVGLMVVVSGLAMWLGGWKWKHLDWTPKFLPGHRSPSPSETGDEFLETDTTLLTSALAHVALGVAVMESGAETTALPACSSCNCSFSQEVLRAAKAKQQRWESPAAVSPTDPRISSLDQPAHRLPPAAVLTTVGVEVGSAIDLPKKCCSDSPRVLTKHKSASAATPQHEWHGAVSKVAARLHQGDNVVLLTGIIGSGSSGTVYMGTWKGLRVAVKTIVFNNKLDPAPGTGEGGASSHRAVMEAAIAASVGHRNLVATYRYDVKPVAPVTEALHTGGLQIDMGLTDPGAQPSAFQKLFLMQELCHTTLAEALSQSWLVQPNGQVDVGAVLALLLDIARGLAYLHSKNIIHGDLKPDNVLLKVEDLAVGSTVAKLTDFGLSARLDPGRTHVSNHSCGTPFFVAPEVISKHQLSTASDVFSFGVIQWALLNQQFPYLPNDDGFVWNPAFPDYPPHLAASMQEYVELSHRCIMEQPRQRPSAQEVVMWLEQHQVQPAGSSSSSSSNTGSMGAHAVATTAHLSRSSLNTQDRTIIIANNNGPMHSLKLAPAHF